MITLKINKNEIYDKSKDSINMNNLSEIIRKRNYSITKVSANTGINDSTLYRYLNNTLIPSLPNLISLADFLQCNLDYLIGRTNDPMMYDFYDSKEIDEIKEMVSLLTEEERKFVRILFETIFNNRDII